jgi:uncharacterized protein
MECMEEISMPTAVKITVNNITVEAELFDTACAKTILKKLPLEAVPDEWGDEFYFQISMTNPFDETATRIVKIGDIGYWPPGNALAIFFGPTPLSRGTDPVPASEVNIVGKITGDATLLRKVKGASTIRLEKSP